MANYDVHVGLKYASGLPQDTVVNVLHFEVNLPDTLNGTSDDIANGYKAMFDAGMVGGVVGIDIKWYEPGLNPTGPVFSKSYGSPYTSATPPGPREVAICLSYATVDDPNAALPRRRGRIYIGPIAHQMMGSVEVAAFQRGLVLDLGEALGRAGNAGNTTWVMYSRADLAYRKIESIWVDNAWDTQRRRGIDPSTRAVRDVQ